MTDFSQLHDDAPLRRVLFTAAILLIAVPFMQAISQLWPLMVGNIQWRWQAANALTSVLLLPFLGLTLLLTIGRSLESRTVSRVAGIISAIFAVGLVVSLILFVLDALQLRAIVSSAQLQTFMNATVRVGLVSTVFTIAFTLLALAGFKTPRGVVTPARKAVRQPPGAGAGLVVGQEFAKAE